MYFYFSYSTCLLYILMYISIYLCTCSCSLFFVFYMFSFMCHQNINRQEGCWLYYSCSFCIFRIMSLSCNVFEMCYFVSSDLLDSCCKFKLLHNHTLNRRYILTFWTCQSFYNFILQFLATYVDGNSRYKHNILEQEFNVFLGKEAYINTVSFKVLFNVKVLFFEKN